MSKILVTGGLGMLGSAISEKFLANWNEVVIVDNEIREGVQFNREKVKKATIIKKDINKLKKDSKPLKDINGIIHCAANPGVPVSLERPLYDFENNALGTLNMLELARVKDVPFLYCSTNKVYPQELIDKKGWELKGNRYEFKDGKPFQFTNDIVGGTHSPYGCSKLTGDIYCSEYANAYGVQTVANRMSCIYNTGQFGNEEQGWLAHFVFCSLLNKPINIYGDGMQVRDVLFGTDTAELYYMQMMRIKEFAGTKWQVGGGSENTLSLLELVSMLEEMNNMKFQVNYHPWRTADHRVYVSDIEPIKKMGWKPTTSVKEGISQLNEWAKQAIKNGWYK